MDFNTLRLLSIFLIYLRVNSQTLTTFPYLIPCPDPSDIAPCECYTFNYQVMYMYCQNVVDEDQLERVFSANIQYKKFQKLDIVSGPIPEITRNVFGDISFEMIYLESPQLGFVSDTAFVNSKDYVQNINVENGLITADSFPFSTFSKLPYLTTITFNNISTINQVPELKSNGLSEIIITNCQITQIPDHFLENVTFIEALNLDGNPINSIGEDAFLEATNLITLSIGDGDLPSELPEGVFRSLLNLESLSLRGNDVSNLTGVFNNLVSLTELDLEETALEILEKSTFGPLTNLVSLRISFSQVRDIEQGTFEDTPKLKYLNLIGNNITDLRNEAFQGPKELDLYLQNNQIQNIESTAFGTSIVDSTINMDNNKIVFLDESWMRDVLERNNALSLYGNSFSCGCEISWIFDNSLFQELIYGRCPDGTNVQNLDPSFYTENC